MCETHRHSGSATSARLPEMGRKPEPRPQLIPEATRGGDPARWPLATMSVSPALRETARPSLAPPQTPQRPAQTPSRGATPPQRPVAPPQPAAPEKVEAVVSGRDRESEDLRDIIRAAAHEEGRLSGRGRRDMGRSLEDTCLKALFKKLFNRNPGPKELKPNYRGRLLQAVRGGLDEKLGPSWRDVLDCPEFLHKKSK